MSLDYVRKIVSGNKARFVDTEMAINLDLVYITDRIIIMGYPAVGVSALYRNRRRDVLKFINARHGDKWWIWNLCPLYENAYSPESMGGRVSRYPFPDHHPPPLPLLPLAVREMRAWLEGDEERVAIIHCKAGKGRSGTLLCSYLLSLPELPPPPLLDRSYPSNRRPAAADHVDGNSASASDRSRQRVEADDEEEGWVVIGGGDEYSQVRVQSEGSGACTPPAQSLTEDDESKAYKVSRSTATSVTSVSRPSPPPSVQIGVSTVPPFDPMDVGDEGAPEDAGQRDRLDGKVDSVFKLHSSRRMKPTSSGRGVSIPSQRRWCRYVNLLFQNRAPESYLNKGSARVSLKSVTLLLLPPSSWQKPLARLVVGGNGGKGKAWASVARYDDEYVDELWKLGGSGEGVPGQVTWGGIGGQGEFDTNKMFRSCGRMVDDGEIGEGALPEDYANYNVHRLLPRLPDGSDSLILDRDREFRLKLHLASMPLGWLWLIPAFHLAESPSTEKTTPTPRTHTLTFSHSQLDFAIGPGGSVDRVIVELEDVVEGDARTTAPLMSLQEEAATGFADRKDENVREE